MYSTERIRPEQQQYMDKKSSESIGNIGLAFYYVSSVASFGILPTARHLCKVVRDIWYDNGTMPKQTVNLKIIDAAATIAALCVEAGLAYKFYSWVS